MPTWTKHWIGGFHMWQNSYDLKQRHKEVKKTKKNTGKMGGLPEAKRMKGRGRRSAEGKSMRKAI